MKSSTRSVDRNTEPYRTALTFPCIVRNEHSRSKSNTLAALNRSKARVCKWTLYRSRSRHYFLFLEMITEAMRAERMVIVCIGVCIYLIEVVVIEEIANENWRRFLCCEGEDGLALRLYRKCFYFCA